MLKAIPLIILSLLFFQCGRKRPNPTPVPQPIPTATPTPHPTPDATPIATPIASPSATVEPTPSIPIAWATPYPTPVFDPLSYIPAITQGRTVTVSGENLADKIQAAQDDPTVGTMRLEGGGSIAKQVTLKKHTVFDGSTYSADMEGITDQGAFLLADGVLVEGTWRPPQALIEYFQKGKGSNWQDPYLLKVQALTAAELAGTGTTILEPTYVNGPFPQIAVFQALGDVCCSHNDKSKNIAVIGFHVKGRQQVYDGGVRSTIQMGNCVNCTAQYNYLEDTGSIGISFAGFAQAFTRPDGVKLIDNHSDNGLIWRNVTSGVAAANIAATNSENLIVAENYVRRPGHHNPKFGGGVCGFDLETNHETDHTKNIGVFNNLFDYEGAFDTSAGNALCLQDPYNGENHGKVIAANNVAIGGRGERSDARWMSNGIYIQGLKGCELVNNYIFRTGQNAIQAAGLDGCLIQDNDLEHTGGGGSDSIILKTVRNTALRRNYYRSRPGLEINADASVGERDGSCGNTYQDYRINGVDKTSLIPKSSICPPQ